MSGESGPSKSNLIDYDQDVAPDTASVTTIPGMEDPGRSTPGHPGDMEHSMFARNALPFQLQQTRTPQDMHVRYPSTQITPIGSDLSRTPYVSGGPAFSAYGNMEGSSPTMHLAVQHRLGAKEELISVKHTRPLEWDKIRLLEVLGDSKVPLAVYLRERYRVPFLNEVVMRNGVPWVEQDPDEGGQLATPLTQSASGFYFENDFTGAINYRARVKYTPKIKPKFDLAAIRGKIINGEQCVKTLIECILNTTGVKDNDDSADMFYFLEKEGRKIDHVHVECAARQILVSKMYCYVGGPY